MQRTSVSDAYFAIKNHEHGILTAYLEEDYQFSGCARYQDPESNLVISLIRAAVLANNITAVTLLVEHGAHVKEEKYGAMHADDQPITLAMSHGYTDIAIYLLQQGATPNGRVENDRLNKKPGLTFLAKAVLTHNIPLIEALILHGASIPKALLFTRRHIESLSDFSAFSKTLLDYAVGFDFHDKQFELSLSDLIDESHYEYDESLFSVLKSMNVSGCNFVGISHNGVPLTPDLLKTKGVRYGVESALFTLADIRRLADPDRSQVLERRLKAQCLHDGAPLVEDGIINFTPLWCAAAKGDVEIISARLNAGIKPSDKSTYHPVNKKSPLRLAVEAGHLPAAMMLISQGGITSAEVRQIYQDIPESQKSQFAALRHYLPVDYRDAKRNTLLHLAIMEDKIDLIPRLIAEDIDFTAENGVGQTALFIAIDENRSLEMVDLLLFHTAKAALSEGEGEREAALSDDDQPWYFDLLLLALGKPQKEAYLKLLIQYGADLNVKTKHGTLLQLMTGWEELEIVALLIKLGADPENGKYDPRLFSASAASPPTAAEQVSSAEFSPG